MILVFDIENSLYRALKHLKSEISGDIYKGVESVPDNSQKEDIEINIGSNPNAYLQVGYGNVNIFCCEQGGERPTKRLQELAKMIEPILRNGGDDKVYWQIESQNAFKDHRRDNMYYVNFKLNIQAI